MINAYMNDSVTIKTAELDQWGTATFTETAVRGRFEFRTKMVRNVQGQMVRNVQGQQVVSSAKVYLANQALSHADKIVFGEIEYEILNIEQVKDFSTKFLKVDLA
jgi:hypothetical protein